MTITPQDIQSKQFHVRLRGFDVDEVDKFLEKISEEFLVLSLEHKQAFERIDALEKEIANYRNKEQGFQNAIISAQRISDEMQERSRRESEETMLSARQAATELEAKSKEEAEATLFRAVQEAEAIRELAESKSRGMVENLGAKMVSLTNDVNRLVALKEGITSDLRCLLEDYLANLEEGMPSGLRGLQPLPAPEPVLPEEDPAPERPTFSLEPELASRQTGLWATARPDDREDAPETAGEDPDDPLESLYEKIDLAEDMLEPPPMAGSGANQYGDQEDSGLDLNDIETLDIDDTLETEESSSSGEREPQRNRDIAIAGMGRDMLFTLEDPLDDLEPSISIRDSGDRNKR